MIIEADKYKEVVEKTIIQTVDLLIINSKNELLLGLRNNKPLKGVYYFPGGRRYKNELLNDSIKRKVKEELGIDIDISKLVYLGVYDDIFEDSIFDNVGTHCSSLTYIYPISSSEESRLVSDSQHVDLKFFRINDNELHEMVKIRLNDAKSSNLL